MRQRVFGIGLNKTGTTTLASCLSEIGYKHQSCRPDLLSFYRKGDVGKIFEVTDSFESFEDWPYPLLYREFYHRYPGAKFILTRRKSPEIWLSSLMRHSLRTSPTKHCRLLAYGYSYPHGAEAQHLDIYQRHIGAVEQFFAEQDAADRLLQICWEEGDGWGKLADFLEVPAPDKALPHENVGTRQEQDEAIRAANVQRIREQIGLLNPHFTEDQLTAALNSSLEGFQVQ